MVIRKLLRILTSCSLTGSIIIMSVSLDFNALNNKNLQSKNIVKSEKSAYAASEIDRTTSGTIIASSENVSSGEGKDKAFDDNTSTKWLALENSAWIQYQFNNGSGYVISKYSISAANDMPTRDPKNWALKASKDGTTWVDLDTRSNQTFTNRFQKNIYTFNNTVSYTYYKLSITANCGANETQLSEIELIDQQNINEVDRAIDGTITASSENVSSGEGKEKAFDDFPSTKWLAFTSTAWIRYQFSGSNRYIISKYSITSANDVPARDPKNWTLKASNDGVNWVNMDIRSNQSFAGRFQKNTYTFINTMAYAYYQIDITANNGDSNMQLSEIELIEQVGNSYVNDSNTKLLMHFDGANGSTSFSDECGKTVSRYGDVKNSNTQSKFGGSSGYFDGNGDYLDCGNDPSLVMGTGDFSVDFWVRFEDSGTRQRIVTSTIGYFSANTLCIRREPDNHIIAYVGSNTIASTISLNSLTWYHIAVTRSGSTVYLFINGSLVGNGTSSSDLSEAVRYIGGSYQTAGNEYVYGYIDELRISKGVARWTSNFTPPSQPYVIETADTQAPTAPTNLAVSNKTTTAVTLTWAAATDNVGIAGYEIYNGSSLAGTSTDTSYTVTGLIANTTYTFIVKAKDTAGNISAASSSLQVTTTKQSNVVCTFNLNDTKSSNIVGRQASDSSWSARPEKIYAKLYFESINITMQEHPTDNTKYRITILPKNLVASCWTDPLNYGIYSRSNPNSASFTINGVSVSYDSTTDLNNGKEYKWTSSRSIDIPKPSDRLLKIGLSVNDSINTESEQYYVERFGWATYKTQGSISNGQTYNVLIDTQVPTTPTNLAVTKKTDATVTLAWTAATDDNGVTGYNIYNGNVYVGTSIGTSYTVVGLTANTAYTFTVRAKDAQDNVSDPSDPIQVTTNNRTNNTDSLLIKVQNIQSFSGRTFIVTYNPNDISSIEDLCSMTYAKETTVGPIADTGITIIQFSPGTIKFTVNKMVESGKSWSGVVNVIKFKPATSGQVMFTCITE